MSCRRAAEQRSLKAASSFDVILLDILMPEMDGYQVLAYVKGQPHLRHIPVIMISALDEMESVVRCVELGATDYLPKPFKPTSASGTAPYVVWPRSGCATWSWSTWSRPAAWRMRPRRWRQAASILPRLDGVGAREDALGRLARVFQRMAREVYLREQRLRQQLEQLRLDMEEMKRAQSEPVDHLHADGSPPGPGARRDLARPDDRGRPVRRHLRLHPPDRRARAGTRAERGAEELTRTISQVYTALIDEVHRYGGSVIGFAGDAITCWFDDITAQRGGRLRPGHAGSDGACATPSPRPEEPRSHWPSRLRSWPARCAASWSAIRRYR